MNIAIEPLDFLIGALYEAGFTDLWEENHMMSSIRAGKLATRRNGDQSKIKLDNKDESRLAEFYLNFFVYGL